MAATVKPLGEEVDQATDGALAAARQKAFIGEACGELSSFFFFVQYLPQIWQNCRRRSTSGFSTLSVWIKLLGASFLFANSTLSGEQFFVILYCIISVLQYNVLIVQAALWTVHTGVLLTLLTPVPAFAISFALPGLRDFTNAIKPITQVASQIALLHCCHQARTVAGVSMLSMHFNFAGGIAGCAACSLIDIKSHWVVWVYINSSLQAASTYAQAWWLRGASPPSRAEEGEAEREGVEKPGTPTGQRSDGDSGPPQHQPATSRRRQGSGTVAVL
eukprot:TRINITY_DN47083_c0_g1_i1.p1 TRINITY_DN47083_c0_g1~~TRINITY_DN47083_c0_g1_i1.p1  ORF type:complete len:320 (+),score=89.53 TRINITY_DN47083_c0_g1_i1:136-960(+)